jgi:hypothetical protein
MLLVACAWSPDLVPSAAAAPPMEPGDEAMDPDARISVSALQDGESRAALTPACAVGDVDACYRLALSWQTGLEGRRNIQKAQGFYQSACDRGHGPSCLALERAAWIGWGSAEDSINVVGELMVVCEEGRQATCLQLAEVLGEVDLQPDVATAIGMAPLGPVTSAGEILGRACGRGNPQACELVRLLALHDDPAHLRRHNGVLCAYDGSATCEAYADACAAGVGGPIDLSEAPRGYPRVCAPWSPPRPPPPFVPPPPPLSPNAMPAEIRAHQQQQRVAAESLRRQPTPETEERDRRRAEDTARSCDKAAALTPDPVMAAELRGRACQHRTHEPCGPR